LSTLPFLAALACYLRLRFQSDAFTPFNAPSYYRFSFSAELITRNLLEYMTRSAELDLMLLGALVVAGLLRRRQPGRNSFAGVWSPASAGLLWFFSFLLPCLFLEVRSDLYAYLPQVGIHLLLISTALNFRLIAPSSVKRE
jgi:hypothetical protein